MIQNVSNKPVAELFSSENQVSYFIPKYQREYICSKFNWESLFDDILLFFLVTLLHSMIQKLFRINIQIIIY